MQKKETTLHIYIQTKSGDCFEANVPSGREIGELATDFIEAQGWSLWNSTISNMQVELVNPEDPDDTKCLDCNWEIGEAGIQDGDVLRIYPKYTTRKSRSALLDSDQMRERFIQDFINNIQFEREITDKTSRVEGGADSPPPDGGDADPGNERLSNTGYISLRRALELAARGLFDQQVVFEGMIRDRVREIENRLTETGEALGGIRDDLNANIGELQNIDDQRLKSLEERVGRVEGTLRRVSNSLKGTKFDRVGGRVITWLHFSDLHLDKNRTGWSTKDIINSLCEDLEHMKSQGIQPDLVFFTGDAAYGHIGPGKETSITHQFEEAQSVFRAVMGTFAPFLSDRNFFIVPGNHDVNRDRVSPAITQSLERLSSKPSGLEHVCEMIQECNADWDYSMEKLDDYQTFIKKNYDYLFQDPQRLIYGDTRDLKGKDVVVGIAGFNSAWSSARDKEKGMLWLGGNQQIRMLRERLSGSEIRVALIHHPLNWLVETEREKLNNRIDQDFHILLHGHDHCNLVRRFGDQHIRIGAGASYGDPKGQSGYNLVKLNIDEGIMDVWLRRYNDKEEKWIPHTIPGKTDNNGVWHLEGLKFTSPIQECDTNPPHLEKSLATKRRTLEELERRADMYGPGKVPIELFNQIAELKEQIR